MNIYSAGPPVGASPALGPEGTDMSQLVPALLERSQSQMEGWVRRECMKCCNYCNQDMWFDKTFSNFELICNNDKYNLLSACYVLRTVLTP